MVNAKIFSILDENALIVVSMLSPNKGTTGLMTS